LCEEGGTELTLSIPECPICYGPYDNIFQRPLLLPCAHTFCLECLSRICLFVKQAQTFPCPLCRAQVPVPDGGIPKLPPNMDVVTQFPPWLQTLQEVWLDGHRLCWIKQPSLSCQVSAGEEAPEMLVTVELLYNPAPRDVSRRDLIGIHHPSRGDLSDSRCSKQQSEQVTELLATCHALLVCNTVHLLLYFTCPGEPEGSQVGRWIAW
uniref:RING-type domain-containing protein n=1 Tax=Chelydra serpentina TaxID=8475 RepID=A0A8C3T4T3_CHESE